MRTHSSGGLTHYLQVTCAVEGLEDVVGEESRRREVLLPEAATLQDVADDGRGQSGHSGRSGTRIFLQPEVLKEVGSIDALLGINCDMFTLALQLQRQKRSH